MKRILDRSKATSRSLKCFLWSLVLIVAFQAYYNLTYCPSSISITEQPLPSATSCTLLNPIKKSTECKIPAFQNFRPESHLLPTLDFFFQKPEPQHCVQFPELTLVILHHKEMTTLLTTLHSYARANLTTKVGEVLLIASEETIDCETEVFLDFGVTRIIKTPKKRQLGSQMIVALENIQTPYFMFLENDWHLIRLDWEYIVQEGLSLIKAEKAVQIRLTETAYVEPFVKFEAYREQLLCEMMRSRSSMIRFREADPRKVKELNHTTISLISSEKATFVCTVSSVCRWSNRPFLMSRKFALEILKPTFETIVNEAPDSVIEGSRDMRFAWRKKAFPLCLTYDKGLFNHREIDSEERHYKPI